MIMLNILFNYNYLNKLQKKRFNKVFKYKKVLLLHFPPFILLYTPTLLYYYSLH